MNQKTTNWIIAVFLVRVLALASIPIAFGVFINQAIVTQRQPNVMDVTSATFKTEVLEARTPVLVVFTAKWCPACQMYKPVIDEASKQYPAGLKFVRVDVDENPEVSRAVDYLPTTVIYDKGGILTTHSGAILEQDRLKKFIDEAIKK